MKGNSYKENNKTALNNFFIYAVRIQAPPTSFIFLSANLEKNRALRITGCLGNLPFPKTL